MMPDVDKYVQVFYTSPMKLRQYAKPQGISYRTALRWFRAGTIKGYQALTGTIIVTEGETPSAFASKGAMYARVSSAEQKANLERQEDLIADVVAIVSSFTARLYGQGR